MNRNHRQMLRRAIDLEQKGLPASESPVFQQLRSLGVDRYLAAYPNAQAQNGTNQQAVVVQSMINFMDRYDDWASANFPTNSGAATLIAVNNAQVAMKTAVQGQYLQSGNHDPIQVNCQ